MEHILIGNHPSIQKIRELIAMVSDTAFNVLLLGETGTGKEVVARLLHQASSRRNKKFIKVNCAALPLTLLESELFGYEKGAFTGALHSKPGKFELASDGVILLDEIGDMPLVLQAKLLHVLQSGEFNRLGGTQDVKVNSWVISSTNHDLEKDMAQGLFREDLYYRLNIIKVELPALWERREDIPLLTGHFLHKCQQELNLDVPLTLDSDILELFQEYHWPGNVRELANTVLRLAVGDDPEKVKGELAKNMLMDGLTPPKGFISTRPEPAIGDGEKENDQTGGIRSLKDIKSEAAGYIERKTIMHALNMTGWNKRKAAKLLKISYKTLFYKMDDFGIGQEA
ncbi:Sigma54 specific transcriptional regulator, Fis family [uncultured Desulfobacterium sp.]|uniref:Sigma54 specific transcriptional regulator, Fis family n=1 Tax=uncultured Desulfobacterium sp. TaxID=201089 RepID=A0A445MZV2_9BACT|nr:Sigma54 specific transcriptional regulator, Fis family [uncultured Desulfobacterium sp.]